MATSVFGGREAEVATVKAFVVSSRRERWIQALDREPLKRRKTIRLYDNQDFDPRFLEPVARSAHRAREVATLLRLRGSPDEIWLMREVTVHNTALDEGASLIVGLVPGLLICVPGRLAYLETETQGGFVLTK